MNKTIGIAIILRYTEVSKNKFYHNTCILLIALFGLTAPMLVAVSDVHAISREVELFDKGCAYYLSYQPDKAAEEFRQFLKEFPGSSSVDAVLFWLAKSLVQMEALEEAKKIYSEIRERYPMSPFNRHIEKEIEIISLLPKEEKISADSDRFTFRILDGG